MPPASAFCREFIQKNLIEFARENAQLGIRTTHVPNRHPVAFGDYVDGSTKEIDLKSLKPSEVLGVLMKMRNTGSGRVRNLRKPVVSPNPSIQGIWDPSVSYEKFEMRVSKAVQSAPASAQLQ